MDETGLIIKENQIVVSSSQIAKNFNKRHDKLISEIERKYFELTNEGCVQNGRNPMFFKSVEVNEQERHRAYHIYYMNRDGFSLLVMGFRGKKALEWKLKYIDAFNQMEDNLRKNASNYNLPMTYKEALIELQHQIEENEKLQLDNKIKTQQIKELNPKLNYYDEILKYKGLTKITSIAKDYGMSVAAFNKMLYRLGIQYKRGNIWFLYQKYQDKGYTESKMYKTNNGSNDIRMITKWTQKGRIFLYQTLKKNGIYPVIERDN